MKESTTYQMILEEGAIAFSHKILLRQGSQRFGPANDVVRATVTSITDLGRLERMLDHISYVGSWQELLAIP